MKPSSTPSPRSFWLLLAGLVGALVVGLVVSRPVRSPAASPGDGGGPSTAMDPVGASEGKLMKGLNRLQAGTLLPGAKPGRETRPNPRYAEYERGLFGAELNQLREMESSTNGVIRGAAGSVRQLLAARMAVRTEAVDDAEPAVEGESEGDAAPPVPAAISDAIASHPIWETAILRDGPRHESFLHDATAEFRRLGVPEAWDAYLTMFLLEAVDEIDMLAAIATSGAPRMGEFPAEVIGDAAPETLDPALYAAWLHRQVTIRMLRSMGVPVDARFEHVFLNAGLGDGLTPYASR